MSLKEFHGSCICGAIKFKVGLDLSTESGRCNCFTCWKVRLWYIRAKPENFELLTSPDAIADYVYKSESHHQKFCKTCGVRPFGTLNKPQLGGEIVGINIACLDDVDSEELANFKIKYMDGKNDSWWLEPKEKPYL